MDNIAKLAMMYSLLAEMHAINAMIEAMKAQNMYRLARDSSPAYGEEAFIEEAKKLEGIATVLRNF